MNDGPATGDPAAQADGRPPELARLAEAVRAIERGGTAPAQRTPQPVRPPASAAASPSPSSPPPSAAPPPSPSPSSDDAGARGTGPAASPPGPALPEKPVEAARLALAHGGAPEALAEAAVETLGERAGELLGEDPWLVLSLTGVRPEQADAFARARLGEACRPDDERRGLALVGWLLARAADAGHTALEWSVLVGALGRQGEPDADGTLRRAVEAGQVMVFQDEREPAAGARSAAAEDGEDPETDILLALDRHALAEESLADGLVRVLRTFDPDAPSGGPEPDWEAAAESAASPSAAALIRAVATSGLVAHSGGETARAEPAALVAAARAAGLRAYAAAHTEDGRRRLTALLGDGGVADDGGDAGTGEPGSGGGGSAAVTVEGLLSGLQGPGRDGDGTWELDLLVVLDAPQLDVERAASLVEAVPDGARLVLSGDPAVLWSTGPGRVFADLLAAKVCPHVVSRTPDPGPIGELVSGIGVGELEAVGSPGKEVVIVPVRDPGEALHRAVQLVADSIPRAIGVPAREARVVALTQGGPVGTGALNAALKERLNPGPGRFGGFDPGDVVVHLPAPGRAVPGTVVSADAAGLRLDCEGEPVLVAPERVADQVRHGWAVTAHQAVGSRWPAAVVVLPGEAPASAPLTRQWVYTAFSRAERHLSVVQGADQALPRAVAERPAKDRTTRLRTILREHAAQG